MNSMEFNKIAGATIGALLIFLLLNFFSGMLYGTRGGDEHVVTSDDEGPVLAYAVPIEASETAAEPEEEQIDLHAILADADPASGEKAFRACGACHAVEAGVNKVGPTLHDVVGREVAAIGDFNYSDAMAEHGGEWTPSLLFVFFGDPKGVVPGTKMSYAGMSNPQQRADVIAYLNEAGDAPIDLTEGLEPLADEDAADEGDAAEADDAAEPAESADEEVAPEATEAEEAAPADAEDAEADEGTDAAAEAEGDEADADAEPAAADESEAEPEEADESSASEGETELADADGVSPFLAGDAAEGEKVFRRCRACHRVEEGANVVGPTLYKVVGREVASVEGFSYSPAMEAHGGSWTPEALSEFLEDPQGDIPGNKMGFAGLKKEQERIDVITYLNGLGD